MVPPWISRFCAKAAGAAAAIRAAAKGRAFIRERIMEPPKRSSPEVALRTRLRQDALTDAKG
ncbi:hypothetical protein D3C81_2136990 [compost metagenome]